MLPILLASAPLLYFPPLHTVKPFTKEGSEALLVSTEVIGV
jgi:hypothetical protein